MIPNGIHGKGWRRRIPPTLVLAGAVTGGIWLSLGPSDNDGPGDMLPLRTERYERPALPNGGPEPTPMDAVISKLQHDAEISPETAVLEAAELGDEAVVTVVAVWARTQPEAAARWVKSQEQPQRDALLTVLAVELTATRLDAALELAEAIEESKARGESLGFVLAQLATEQPQEVFGWLEHADGDPVARRRWERQALAALAAVDPLGVGHWVAEGRVHPAAEEPVIAAVVRHWSRTDAKGAAEWVADFPDPRLRQGALQLVMKRWATEEPDAASNWVQHCENSVVREEAGEALATALAAGR